MKKVKAFEQYIKKLNSYNRSGGKTIKSTANANIWTLKNYPDSWIILKTLIRHIFKILFNGLASCGAFCVTQIIAFAAKISGKGFVDAQKNTQKLESCQS